MAVRTASRRLTAAQYTSLPMPREELRYSCPLVADVQSLSSGDPRSLGRYELLGRLGEGSQGVVYLARDPTVGAQVAIKLLRAHLSRDGASRARFLREATAAKRVPRFCTAQLIDVDLADAQPYIVSEYISGPSLATVVRTDGPRTGTALERIAVNTATALAGIHQAGIIHRDFKAANVVLGPDGPVVIDFGIAKALDAVDTGPTLPGQAAGTPGYMAPDQFEEKPVGPAVDIFAWGVTMTFAATGTLPFGTGPMPAVIYRILNEPPRLDGLAPPLRDLVARCLDKDPAARPTAREVVDRLLERNDSAVAAASPMTPPGRRPRPPARATLPADGADPAPFTDATLHLDEEPFLNTHPPSDNDPIHAVRMHQSAQAPDFGTQVAAAPKSMRSRQVPRWTVVAAAVLVLVGGAAAAMALTGSTGSGKPSAAPAAGALPGPSGPAAAAAVSHGKPGKHPASSAASGTRPGTAQRGKSTHPVPGSTVGKKSGGSGTSATSSAPPQSTAPNPPASSPTPPAPSPTTKSVPNPYSPTQVCGSGYEVIDSHALSGGTIYLLYDNSNGDNCVTTMRSYISGKISIVSTLKVEGGSSSSDSGEYTYYAGPVRLEAAKVCVEWGGAIGSSSWTSGWSHCG
jgi:serine/threonine protein kinase